MLKSASSPYNRFLELYRRFELSTDPEEKILLASESYSLLDEVDSWPINGEIKTCKRVTSGILLIFLIQSVVTGRQAGGEADWETEEGLIALGLQQLNEEDGVLYLELLWAASGFFAQTPSGNPLDNITQLIGMIESALSAAPNDLEPELGAKIYFLLSNLRTYLVTLPGTNPNLHSIAVEEAHKAQKFAEKSANLELKLNTKIQLADSLVKFPTSNGIISEVAGFLYLKEVISLADPNEMRHLWLRARILFAEYLRNPSKNLNQFGSFRSRILEAVSVLDEAISFLQKHGETGIETIADLSSRKITTFAALPKLEKARMFQEATQCATRVFTEYSLESNPTRYLTTLNNYACFISSLELDEAQGVLGNLVGDIEDAIGLVTQAGEIAPIFWELKFTLANCLAALRIENETGQNQEKARLLLEEILNSVDPKEGEETWLRACSNLGNLYPERIYGNSAENNRESIILLSEVLSRVNFSKHPLLWEETAINLAQTFLQRIEDDVADNVEYALCYLEAALTVSDQDSSDDHLERLYSLLAEANYRRRRGSVVSNLENSEYGASHANHARHDLQLKGSSNWLMDWKIFVELSSHENSATQTQSISTELGLHDLDHARTQFQAHADSTNRRNAIKSRLSLIDILIRNYPGWKSTSDGNFWRCQREDFLEASRLAEEALEIADNSNLTKATCESLERLVLIYRGLSLNTRLSSLSGDEILKLISPCRIEFSETARDEVRKARDFQARLMEVLEGLAPTPAIVSEAVILGELQVELGDWEDASRQFNRCLEILRPLVGAYSTSNHDLEQMVEIFQGAAISGPFALAKAGHMIEAIQFGEESKELFFTRQGQFLNRMQSMAELEEVESCRQSIEASESALASPFLIGRKTALDHSIQQRERLQSLLGELDLTTNFDSGSTHDILAELTTNGQILIFPYHASNDGTALICYSKNRKVEFDLLPLESQKEIQTMTKIVSEWVEADGELPMERNFTFQLFGKLKKWAETQPDLTITHIFLVTDGRLSRVPLEIDIEAKDFILDKITLSVLSRLPASSSGGTRESQTRWGDCQLMAIGTRFSNHTPEFQPTMLEAEVVRASLAPEGHPALLDTAATREQVCHLMRACNVWHFGCHGVFDVTDPLKSRLILADDQILSVKELLVTKNCCAPDLVVLSACETGRSEDKDFPFEMLSLVTAFQHLGAKCVLASRWEVPDLATFFLISRFYEHLTKKKEAPPMALRSAQTWLKESRFEELLVGLEQWTIGICCKSNTATVRKVFTEEYSEDEHPFENPINWAGFVCHQSFQN